MGGDGSGLTAKQRAQLKALAHPLKPVVQVGKGGVDEEVARSLLDALRNRELLKVKVLEAAPLTAKDAATELAAAVPGAKVVQVIGRTVVLYRRHPHAPEIRL